MGLRVLLAADFYPPFTGGSEIQMQLLGRQLAMRGHEVNVVTVWHAGLPYEQEDSGIKVFRLKGISTQIPWFFKDPGRRRYHPPFPDPSITWGIRRLIRKLKPDLVHSYGWISYSCAAALLGKQIPMVVSARDYGHFCAVRIMLNKGQICDGPAFAKCLKCAAQTYGLPKALAAVTGIRGSRGLLLRKADMFHVASTFVQETAHRFLCRTMGNNDIPGQVIIPNIIEIPQQSAIQTDYIKHLPQEPFILFVGALQEHKGIHVLLAAYSQLTSPPPLVLMGTTWPDTPSEFPAGVTVIRNVPHDSVMYTWERCLFGVTPSMWAETFGNVIVEAMSKGKPVIASNVGGPVDIVEDNKSGLLVPIGDVDALAKAMHRLISDPDLRNRLGRAAEERAGRYTAKAIIPRFEKLYGQLVETIQESSE